MNKVYITPKIEITEAEVGALVTSGPGTDDIGSPSVNSNAKEYSVWDEVEQLNHKEENYEVYE